MANFREIKERIFADVNPAMRGTIFSGDWRFKNNAWEYERGKCRITRTIGGGLYLHGNTGSGMAGHSMSLIDDFLCEQYNLNITTPADVFKELAHRYGVDWDDMEGNSGKISRSRVAEFVWPSLMKEAQKESNQETAGAQYLIKRGFSPQNGEFGLLTDESIKEAKNAVKEAFTGLTDEVVDNELNELGINTKNIQTRPVVMNLKTNGKTNGFTFRAVVDVNGPKYLNSKGINKGVYSDTLIANKPAVIVEGPIDSIRLKSLGVANVIAMNGATVGDSLRDILQAYNINDVILWPDLEYDKDGTKITKRTADTLRALVDTCDNMEGWKIQTVRVVEIYPPDGVNLAGYKTDPDTYGKDHPDEVANKIYNAIYWYLWELVNFEGKCFEKCKAKTLNAADAQNEARDIYRRINDPLQRGYAKEYVSKNSDFYKELGITPESLTELDEINRNEAYKGEVNRYADKLTKAAKEGATPEKIGRLIAGLNEVQARGTGARDEWDQQTSKTWEQEVTDYCNHPTTIKTKWALGNKATNTGEWRKFGNIEFWPADITVFCAPTSHGKTMILFQSLIDLVKQDIAEGIFRKYIYLSCEETHAQLFGRALNVYIPQDYNVLFKTTRRNALRAYLRGECPQMYAPDQTAALNDFLKSHIEAFKTTILPRIDLIHTEATTEAISSNIDHYTAKYRRDGVEVGAVLIDYFQLLTAEGGDKNARNYEMKTICKTLKDTAARGDVPYIMAAQLNRLALSGGLDEVTLSNIGEGADIERIAHDVYLLWQTDKTRREQYVKQNANNANVGTWKKGGRVERLFDKTPELNPLNGFLYIERLKARESVTGLWGLLPYDGESGQIGETKTENL